MLRKLRLFKIERSKVVETCDLGADMRDERCICRSKTVRNKFSKDSIDT